MLANSFVKRKNAKYQMTNNIIIFHGIILYKIKCLRRFQCCTPVYGTLKFIEKGEWGGYIQSEWMLSHSDGEWVHKNNAVIGDKNDIIYGNLEDISFNSQAYLLFNHQLYDS